MPTLIPEAGGGGNTLQQWQANRVAAAAAAEGPKIVVPGHASTGPKPTIFDADGKRYTAPPGNYIGHDPSNLYCQGGNTAPCACATQELKDYILQNGLCTVSGIPGPAIRGIGAVQTVYSAYTGRPDNTFKWFDKWFSQTDGFNPCDVLRLPTCKVDCNGPEFEPVRISGESGWCRSTRVQQVPGTPYSPKVQTTYGPSGLKQCPAGSHFASGGCVPDKPITQLVQENPPTSSSMMTGAWWLLLLVAAGGVYYLSTKKKGK